MRRNLRLTTLAVAAATLLGGCASPQGIVALSGERFALARNEVASYPGRFNFRTELVAEATRHCAKSGKALNIVDAIEIPARNVIVNYRWARIEFECLPARDRQQPRNAEPNRKVA